MRVPCVCLACSLPVPCQRASDKACHAPVPRLSEEKALSRMRDARWCVCKWRGGSRCERERSGWRAACSVNQTQKRTAYFIKRFLDPGQDILVDEAFERAVERAKAAAIGPPPLLLRQNPKLTPKAKPQNQPQKRNTKAAAAIRALSFPPCPLFPTPLSPQHWTRTRCTKAAVTRAQSCSPPHPPCRPFVLALSPCSFTFLPHTTHAVLPRTTHAVFSPVHAVG